MKRHYDNLGLPQTASQADVKRAYRKLAMKLHPDKNPHPQAATLFFELQESYDVLMAHLDPNRPTFSNEQIKSRKEKSKEERIKEAKMRFEEQNRKEKLANDLYFNSLTKGIKWKVFKTGSLICAIVAVFLFVDYLIPNRAEKDEIIGWSHKERGGIVFNFVHPIFLKNNGKLHIKGGLYNDIHSYPTAYIAKTQLLHLPIRIIHPVEDEIKTYDLDLCLSIALPFGILFFAFPLLLLVYKRRSPDFVFSYFLSLYIIFPLTAIFLIVDYRWLHLLSLGFL